VILRVNSKPTDAGARDVTVVPIDDEAPLYYIDWVQKNIDYVTKKTGLRGWLHSHPRHGSARPQRVHEALLSADPETRAHC